MRHAYQVVHHDAAYCLARSDGDTVYTPNGRLLSSNNRSYLLFLKRHLNRLGERLDNGLSPYGLAVGYLDFGQDHQLRTELCTLLIDELACDLLLSKPYLSVANAMHQHDGIDISAASYVDAIAQLDALRLWVLTQYVINYHSVVLGYNLIVSGMSLPDSVAELFGRLLTEQLRAEDRDHGKYSVTTLYPALASARRYVPGNHGTVARSRIEQFQRKRFEKRVLWARQVASYGNID